MTKDDIRELSKRLGLKTWNKPSFACLSSRIPYGTRIEKQKIDQLDEAENFLMGLGLWQVRVRHHDTLARLEIHRDEMTRALDPEINAAILRALKTIGYRYVSLDLQGYRTGSLNEGLLRRPA